MDKTKVILFRTHWYQDNSWKSFVASNV